MFENEKGRLCPGLHGLVPQASAFDTSLLSLSLGWNKIDIVARAIQQITAAKEFQPTFICIHPTDWWGIRLAKESYGRYILGDPTQPAGITMTGGIVTGATNLFGLMPIVTTNIAVGTFIIGSGNRACVEIRDRMEMVVEMSTLHSDYFVKNLIAIRAEKRLALITKRQASFLVGSFSSSPA